MGGAVVLRRRGWGWVVEVGTASCCFGVFVFWCPFLLFSVVCSSICSCASAPHLFAGTTAEAALQTMGVSLTPSKSRVVPHDKFLFQDFHEGTFQHVRAALGISNEDFAASLSEVCSSWCCGAEVPHSRSLPLVVWLA